MLTVENLTKKYRQKTVLDDVSFEIEAGRICGLVGLNGAGKSTLMKVMCSLVAQDAGNVSVDGMPLRQLHLSGKERIGFMIESPAFFGTLTGRENLSVLAALYPKLEKDAVDSVLLKVGLWEQADTTYHKYSLGMKQRLYLAYAILDRPTVLILDEPFNGIDPVAVRIEKNIIKEYAQSGATVLVSAHNLLDIQSVCDSVLILDRGKLLYRTDHLEGVDLEEKFLSLVAANGLAQ